MRQPFFPTLSSFLNFDFKWVLMLNNQTKHKLNLNNNTKF